MSDIKSPLPLKTNFDFVDTIRCISMIGIVFEHNTHVGEVYYKEFSMAMIQASVMQFFKFATIAFFLIGGFLINHKFTEYTPLQYIKNRFKNTIGPWTLWLNIFVLLNIINLLVKKYLIYHDNHTMPPDFSSYLGNLYYETIFLSSFWFILNFLICISILLIFKKYIYHVFFGCILGLVSLFYSVNLYYGWIITNHSTALFGFVFYLWLGAFLNKHYESVSKFIRQKSLWFFILITVILFIFSDMESVILKNLGNNDAFNTLRFTNILYSISFFFLLLKIGPLPLVNKYLEPRKTTFGIYLIHQIIITYVLIEIVRPFKINVETLTLGHATLYSLVCFLIVYCLSFALVALIKVTRFKWAIGAS